MKYWTVKETAATWDISTRRVQGLAKGNRIPGAKQRIIDGKCAWLIPADTPRPERLKPGVKPKEKHPE